MSSNPENVAIDEEVAEQLSPQVPEVAYWLNIGIAADGSVVDVQRPADMMWHTVMSTLVSAFAFVRPVEEDIIAKLYAVAMRTAQQIEDQAAQEKAAKRPRMWLPSARPRKQGRG